MVERMNERIRELAKEARLLTGWPVGEVEYQEFAELIVRECAEWVNDNIGLIDEEARADLLKHFGVEE
jgi:hypothetical protein